MKLLIIFSLCLTTFALQAELKNDLVLILKEVSIKKDPVKNLPIRATYKARSFNDEIDRLITISFKNSFAEPYQLVTHGARLLKVGELVRVYTDHPSLVEKVEDGYFNSKETLVNELFSTPSVDHEKFEKVVSLMKDEVLLNCHSSYMSLVVTKGQNYFVTLHMLAKDNGNTVFLQDSLMTVDQIKEENTLVLDRIYGRIFLTLNNKKLDGIFFEPNLMFYSLPQALSSEIQNPAKIFFVDNAILNDGLSCSSFKYKSLIELL
jgi:hypothetical protein